MTALASFQKNPVAAMARGALVLALSCFTACGGAEDGASDGTEASSSPTETAIDCSALPAIQ
jgi:hypothetical protein